MNTVKKSVFGGLICLIMVFVCPLCEVFASDTPQNQTDNKPSKVLMEEEMSDGFGIMIGYLENDNSFVIEKGEPKPINPPSSTPVKTSDMADLHTCLMYLIFSTISLFIVIVLKRKVEKDS